MAPPLQLPPNVRIAYIAEASIGSGGWGWCVVRGGDGEFDLAADQCTDGAGPASNDSAGETDRLLTAAFEAVDFLVRGGSAPVLLRTCRRQLSQMLTAVYDPQLPAATRRRLCAARTRLADLQALCPGAVWVTSWFEDLRPQAWGERALALAHQGAQSGKIWGHVSPPLAHSARATTLLDDSAACPICFEDYSSKLPTPELDARAPPGRWLCTGRFCHAVCRACDPHVQSTAGNPSRCPLCRAARVVLLGPWQAWPH